MSVRLLSHGVFVELSSGRYYIDLAKAEAFRARRRVVLLATVGAVLVAVLLLQWMR